MSQYRLRTPFETTLENNERFRPIERLGEGGSGLVYRVHDRERGQDVALKTVHARSAGAIYQLKREFRTLADIRHPNLVVLHELLCIAGEWCFTMELVEGCDFLSYVSGQEAAQPASGLRLRNLGETNASDGEHRCDSERLLRAFGQLASAVATLHQHDVLHLDLKPGNVLVRADGRVAVLDFGLARDLEVGATVTENFAAGTPAYMAPEQADRQVVTRAADWYAVGAMAYEALTGTLPFDGPALQMLLAKATQDATPPRERAPSVDPAWNELCVKLLVRDPEARAGYQDVRAFLDAQAGPASPATITGTTTAHTFVGREDVFASLARAQEAVREGTPRVMFVHGQSGIGKTAVIHEYMRRATLAENTWLLEGRCFERESVPYKALDSVIDALSRVLRALPMPEARQYIPPHSDALVRVFPVLARVPTLAVSPRKGRPREQQNERDLAFQALKWLLSRLGDVKPVVIFIDDLQWGDRDSGQLVRELLTPPDPPRVLWLGTYRTEEGASSQFLQAVSARNVDSSLGGEIERIALAALPEEQVLVLLRSMLHQEGRDENAAAALARECAGNPFFAGELVRSTRTHDAGRSATLEAVLLDRIAALPDEQRALVETVSLIGRPTERSLVLAVAGLELGDSDSFDVLRLRRLVRTRGARAEDLVEPYHDRIREIVSSSLAPERRVALHLRVARELESRARGDEELLMLHYTEADVPERAAHYAVQAARNAGKSLAFDHAARLFRRALALNVPRTPVELSDLHAELGHALDQAGQSSDAADAYLEAARHAEGQRMIELHLMSAQQLLLCGRYEQGIKLLRQTLPAYGVKLTTGGAGAVVSLLLTRARLALRGLSFDTRDASEIDPSLLARIDASYAVAAGLGPLDPVVAADAQSRSVLMALDAGEPARVLRALMYEACFRGGGETSGQVRAREILKRAHELAAKLALPEAEGLCDLGDAFVDLHGEGNLVSARDAFARGETRLVGAPGNSGELANLRCSLMTTYDWLGEAPTLMQRVPGLVQDAERRGDQVQFSGMLSGTLFWLSRNATEELAAYIETARARWPKDKFLMPSYWFLVAEAHRDLYLGDAQRCLERMAEAWPDLKRSLYLTIPTVRIEIQFPRARAALLAASRGGPEVKKLLRMAESDLKTLEASRRAYALPLAALGRCAVAHIRGQHDGLPERLRAAAEACDRQSLALYAATARRALGELIGGDEGRALRALSDDVMRARGVRDPEALTRALGPGLVRT